MQNKQSSLQDMYKDAREARDESIRALFRGAGNNLAGENLQNYVSQYEDVANQKADALSNEIKRNRYFGDNIIGTILNHWAQTIDTAGDLVTGKIGERYDKENPMLKNVGGGTYNQWKGSRKANDLMSDIGAVGEAAFDALGFGALGNAVKGGTKLTANLGKTALRTGLLGAGENAFATVREGGRDTNVGDVLTNAGIGGVIGGGIGALSQLGGNAANIAKQVRSPQMRTLNEYYQNALAGNSAPLNPTRMLGDGVGGASVGTAGNYLDWVPKEAKAAMERSGTPLAKTGIGRVFQGFGDSNAIYGSPLAPIMNSKVGQTTRNILKTPAGKIGAGVGGGLLVASLLRGGGNDQAQADNDLSNLSDEQLLQLLNYYNNGGY